MVQPVSDRNRSAEEALPLPEALLVIVVQRGLLGWVPHIAPVLVQAAEEDITEEAVPVVQAEEVARATPTAPIFLLELG
jgi:hypothetical protein